MIPNRRTCITETIEHNEDKLHVSVGQVGGQVCEVFAYGPKTGSEASALLIERCREASKQLQHGATPEDFAPYVERDEAGIPRTSWGAVVDVLNAMEA